MAEVHGQVCDSKSVSPCEGQSVFGWKLHCASARVMDTPACSISLRTNQPYMMLHLQMLNTPIIDAVMNWCFNLACLRLGRKQPIHLINEVISAIYWPCRFTYGHYTVLYVKHYQSLAGLVTREAGNLNGLNEYQIDHIQTAWPVHKSVKIRYTIDIKKCICNTVPPLFTGHYIKLDFCVNTGKEFDLDKIEDKSG